MTYQRDPDDRDPVASEPIVPKPVERQDPRAHVRREGGSWPILPLALALVFIIVLSFIFTSDNATTPERTTGTNVETPTTTTPTVPETTPSQPK